MKRIFFYIVGLLVFSTFLCEGAGLVAWKQHTFYEDSLAHVSTYSRKRFNGNKGIFHINGKDIYLPGGRYWFIEIPNTLPLELVDSWQYEDLLRQRHEMRVFRDRFPKSSAILDPWLKRLQEYQDNYDSGKRFVNGVWMEKSTYEQQQTAQREKRNQRCLQEEQKRKEADKNTVGTDSRSAGREEKNRIPYADGSLKEISGGSVEGARTVVKRLEQSKKSLDPAGRNQAEQVIQSIKRLFTAQSAYKKALQQQAGAKAKAEQYERQAENNMRPNPLTGEPNSYMANRARKQAREIILNAEHALISGKRELLQALKQSDTLACTLYKTIPQDAESLALAVAAIAESYHGEIDFRSRFEEVRDKEDRRQEEIAREQEEREQQLAREKNKEEKFQQARARKEQRLRKEHIAREQEEERERQLVAMLKNSSADAEVLAARVEDLSKGDYYELMLNCILRDDVDLFDKIVHSGKGDINYKYPERDHLSLLQCAVMFEKPDIVEILLENGCLVEKKDFLHILKAVKDGKFNEKMEEINRLRQAFDPEINRLVNERGKGTINDDSWKSVVDQFMSDNREYKPSRAVCEHPFLKSRTAWFYHRLAESNSVFYKKAFKWFSRSAAAGVQGDSFILASLYYKGEGTQKDLKQALFWMEKAAAQSDELAIKALPKIRKEAEENMDAVKAPSTLFHLTVPDRPKAPATPPVKYMSDTDTNRMIYRTLGSPDPRALEGIDEKNRNVIQTSTDPVEISKAAEKAYADKGTIDPAMRQYLTNMAHYRALSNKTGQGTAYHPSLSRAFPSLPTVMEMGDEVWAEEVDKIIGTSQETYDPNLSLACRQRARDIIEARSRIMGGSMDRPEDIYRRLGISEDTDPVSEDTNCSPLSGMALPLIFLGLLIVIPLGVFCRLRRKL